jgi:hypothetical protein
MEMKKTIVVNYCACCPFNKVSAWRGVRGDYHHEEACQLSDKKVVVKPLNRFPARGCPLTKGEIVIRRCDIGEKKP